MSLWVVQFLAFSLAGPSKIEAWNHPRFHSSSAQAMKLKTQLSRLTRLLWQWPWALFMRSSLFVCLASRVHSARCVFARSIEWSRETGRVKERKDEHSCRAWLSPLYHCSIYHSSASCVFPCSFLGSRWPWWRSLHGADHQNSRTSSSLRESDKRPGADPDELTLDWASDTNQALEGSAGIHKYLGTKRGLWSLL